MARTWPCSVWTLLAWRRLMVFGPPWSIRLIAEKSLTLSFFATFQVKYLQDVLGMSRCYFDQCMFGCHAKKPTEILTNDVGPSLYRVRCIHLSHVAVVGLQDPGTFRTTCLAQYPDRLCDFLAWRAALSCADPSCFVKWHGVWGPPRGCGAFPPGGVAKQLRAKLQRGSTRLQN